MVAADLDFVLAEVQRVRGDRATRLEAQDTRLSVLFALSGALVVLSALLPWHLALATAMFAGFGVYYASEGLRSEQPSIDDVLWVYDRVDVDQAEVAQVYLKSLLEQTVALERRLEDKAWCMDMTRLFLICAFVSAGLGLVVRAVEVQP
ncbi:MAG: hypothetical protein ACXV2I_03880 [Actinomycetes bacterium]